jgi:arginyl-tRNA synthetase
MDNPVYYLQYAHARSCSLLKRWGGDVASLMVEPQALTDEHAGAVMAELRWFSATLAFAARERAPHRVAHWLISLASSLHSYYDKVPVLGGDAAGRPSRLALVAATRNALAVGLDLLGVNAPSKM